MYAICSVNKENEVYAACSRVFDNIEEAFEMADLILTSQVKSASHSYYGVTVCELKRVSDPRVKKILED